MKELICLNEENLLRDLKNIEIKINNIKNVIYNVKEGGKIKEDVINIARKDIRDLNKYFRYINSAGIDRTLKQNLLDSNNKIEED